MERLYDMHCHLGSMSNAELVAKQAERLGLALLNVTVSPADADACACLAHHPNVRTARGLHPWWIDNGTCDEEDVARAAIMCAGSRFVGEVGLDFGGARAATAPQQIEAFEWIIQSCAEHPVAGRIYSIHAVRAASEALDALQRFDMPHNSTCIFHWFSGTSDEFSRARALGCHFSVNARMLATKRGREYARQVPLNKLLLETDAPREFGTPGDAQALVGELTQALDALSRVRGESRELLAGRIAQTSQELLQ